MPPGHACSFWFVSKKNKTKKKGDGSRKEKSCFSEKGRCPRGAVSLRLLREGSRISVAATARKDARNARRNTPDKEKKTKKTRHSRPSAKSNGCFETSACIMERLPGFRDGESFQVLLCNAKTCVATPIRLYIIEIGSEPWLRVFFFCFLAQ